MTEWVLILTPILVLPIVLLFRFVGCAQIMGVEEPILATPAAAPPSVVTPPQKAPDPTPPVGPPATPPRYRDYIMGEPNNPGTVKHNGVTPDKAKVIAYWRLVDAPGMTAAKDEKGFQDGQYKEGQALDPVAPMPMPPPTAKGGSQPATGDILTGQNGLIKSQPTALGRYFNGGYVRVPFKTDLYTEEFTIEAWVLPHGLTLDYEYTLFQAGGTYPIPPAAPLDHGFQIFENRFGRWQVRLAPGTTDFFQSPPLVPRPGPTHLAVTVANEIAPDGSKTGSKKVVLYVDGKITQIAIANSYSKPDGADLFIGVENTAPSPANPVQLRTPVLSQIQEVVIHNTALSQEEIENHIDINR
jgi:hypothetical protein